MIRMDEDTTYFDYVYTTPDRFENGAKIKKTEYVAFTPLRSGFVGTVQSMNWTLDWSQNWIQNGLKIGLKNIYIFPEKNDHKNIN